MSRARANFVRRVTSACLVGAAVAGVSCVTAPSASAASTSLSCKQGGTSNYVKGTLTFVYARTASGIDIDRYSFKVSGHGNRRLHSKNNVSLWLNRVNTGAIDSWGSGSVEADKVYTVTPKDNNPNLRTSNRVRHVGPGSAIYVKARFVFDERNRPDTSCEAVTAFIPTR